MSFGFKPTYHQFDVLVPPDYFVKKFNFLISKSNSIEGRIKKNGFIGTIGPDFYPLSAAVIQIYSLYFVVEDNNSNTRIKANMAFNPYFLWLFIGTLTFVFFALLFSFFFEQFAWDVLLFLISAFIALASFQMVIVKKSRITCVNHFSQIVNQVEAAYHSKKNGQP
jgi:hypothetical protein